MFALLLARCPNVPAPPVGGDQIPVLQVHHGYDHCRATDIRDIGRLRARLCAPRSGVLKFNGGRNEGPACEAFAYHGFNGIEAEVPSAIVHWILAP